MVGRLLDGLTYHRCLAGAGTDGVDADSLPGILQRRRFGQPKYTMLRGVVSPDTGDAYQTALRRAVYDGSLAVLFHLDKFVLHTVPHTAQIDRSNPVEIPAFGFRQIFPHGGMYAHVIISYIQLAENSDRLFDSRFHLCLVRYVAPDTDGVVSFRFQFLGTVCYPTIQIGHDNRRTGFGKHPCGGITDTASRTRNKCHFIFKTYFHRESKFFRIRHITGNTHALTDIERVIMYKTNGKPDNGGDGRNISLGLFAFESQCEIILIPVP